MSLHVEIFACTPLLNCGTADRFGLTPFDFSCGASLVRWDGSLLARMASAAWHEHCSQSELRQMMVAAGWICLNHAEDISNEPTPHHIAAYNAANILRTLLWCLYLAGAEENDYWRGGNLLHACAIYVSSTSVPIKLLSPIRFPFYYSLPPWHGQQNAWRPEVMSAADRLYRGLMDYPGKVIPRLARACQIQKLAATRSVIHGGWKMRFQLAYSALETFYIDPQTENKHLHDSAIRARIREVCGEALASDGFFENARQLRNDIAHRWELSANLSLPSGVSCLQGTLEKILTRTICWGIENQERIFEAFSKRPWISK